MQRALQLAWGGEMRVAPNPMVGAVVVAKGKIIGEGFHAEYGGPHAEVNAIRSVPENKRHLLKESTIYVTLEPCSHFGKTPPCANLIVECGIPEVVIGAPDPNPLVAGKGILILEKAGIIVRKDVLLEKCIEINRKFMFSQLSRRPWVQLKWAQSADGYMAPIDKEGNPYAFPFSNSLTKVWMHRERANSQAIMIGGNTEKIDRPLLNVRYYAGKDPKKLVLETHSDIPKLLEELRKEGIASLMVEGGPTLLASFINERLFDEIRVEIADILLFNGLKAPRIPDGVRLISSRKHRKNIINVFRS